MTKEQIKQRALETYPLESQFIAANDEFKREGYIKALEELEKLPKIKGWIAREKSNELIFSYINKPKRSDNEWIYDGLIATLDPNTFLDLTFVDDPIEVELLIRKI